MALQHTFHKDDEKMLFEFLVRALVSQEGYEIKNIEIVRKGEIPSSGCSSASTSPRAPRMRTAQEVYAEIKRQDPETQIALHFIRYIIATESVRVVRLGQKKLVDLDEILSYIASGCSPNDVPPPATGGIRRVRV